MAKRVRTNTNRPGTFDLRNHEFDTGFRGARQRIRIVASNLFSRFWRDAVSFFTSFLGLHYVYVISWALIVSWILYPEHNISYTDALFQAVSTVCLSGLNTVNINDLKLYQQLFIFIIPVFTHPLTVASFMVHHRLYLYKRKFEGIEENSKHQSKLRRQATTQRLESQRQRSVGAPNNPLTTTNVNLDGHPSPPEKVLQSSVYANNESSSSQSRPASLNSVDSRRDEGEEEEPNKIRFGALPRPPDRKQFDPSEMFRSLNMMRNQLGEEEMDEDDGPALVIKSPRDIEADEMRGIHSAVADRHLASAGNNLGDESFDGPHRRLSHVDGLRLLRTLTRADTMMSIASGNTPKPMASNYLSWTPTVGHNSTFIGLSRQQKEELGGVEYRALKMLRWITLGYYVGVLAVGWLMMIPWVYERKTYANLIESHGVSPVLFAMTTVLSAFNNSGYCTLPSSLAEFWDSAYVPVVISFMILAGNVALPIFMQTIIWILFKFSPQFGQARETLGFLLDHPRRCFILLFPRNTTLWLLASVLMFMIVEVALFMILNSGVHSPQPNMSAGPRLLCAYFQSVTVRTVGFTIVDISAQHPAMQILNTISMYMGIYPVAMSIRKSNVYEEQTLGHYYTDDNRKFGPGSATSIHSNAIDDTASDAGEPRSGNNFNSRRDTGTSAAAAAADSNRRSTDSQTGEQTGSGGQPIRRRLSEISSRFRNDAKDEKDDSSSDDFEEDEGSPSTLVDHMRRQLSMDIWMLVLSLLLIAITEGGPLTRGRFSLFGVIYEIVSAHGAVGMSMGLSGTSLSLSGGFSNLGKLIMMAIMIRARHRGMPYNLDRSIILNGADMTRRDREQENRTRDPRLLHHIEPAQAWLPRVATTASRLRSFGTLRRRSTQPNVSADEA